MKFGVLVTKQKDILQDMFTKDKNSTDKDGENDGGISSRQKSSDDFKFWLNLKSEGTKKTTKHIESILQNTQTCIKLIQSRKSFKLVMKTFELTSVSFVYKPKQYKEENAEVLDGIQIQLETILKSKKITSVYYTNSSVFEHGKYGFLKIDVGNKDEEDLEALISKIEKYGQGIEVSGASKAKADRLVTSDENQYSSKSTTTTITHNTTSVTKTKGVSDTGSSEEVIVTKKKYTKKTVTTSTNENTDTESENADRNEGESNQDEQDTRIRRASSDKNVLDKTLPDGSSEEKTTTKKKFTKKTITKSTKGNSGTEKKNGDRKEVEGDEEQNGTMGDGSASDKNVVDKTEPIGSSEELIITKKKYTKKTVTTSTTGNTDNKTANADSKDEESNQEQQETKENAAPSDKNEMNSPDGSSEGNTMTRKTYTKKTVMTSTKGNTDTKKKNADRKEVESDEEQLGTKRQGPTSHKNKMNPPNGSSEEKTITRKNYTKKTEARTTKGNAGTKKKNSDSNEADADSKEKYPYSKKKNANSKKDNVDSKEEDGDQKPVKNKGYGSPSANDQMFPSSIFFG